jgi:hypothetical protein
MKNKSKQRKTYRNRLGSGSRGDGISRWAYGRLISGIAHVNVFAIIVSIKDAFSY